MKKKLLSFVMCLGMIFGVASLSSCKDVKEALDMTMELTELEEKVDSLTERNNELFEINSSLNEENEILKNEILNLRFEVEFPKGLISKSCTLNGLTVSRKEVNPEGSVYAVRVDGEGVEVTINGGTYNAGEGSLYNIAVWAHNGSSIIINDGEFTVGNDVNGEFNHCVYAAGNSTIEINGGWFESTGDSSWLVNCQDGKGTIVIKGGTFVNFDPSNNLCEGENTSYVPEGYVVVKEVVEGVSYYTVVEITEE